MARIKRWLIDLCMLATLAIGLGVWGVMPWYGALACAAGLIGWLLSTRTGRLTLMTTRIGISGLPQRRGAAGVIVIGIAGVVGVLVAMLAMSEGFEATLKQTGSDDTAIILRGGSQSEINSIIQRDQLSLIRWLPGIAKDADGLPLVSAEQSQLVSLATRLDGSDANAQLRGIGEAAWTLRPQLRIVEGRAFAPGVRELVVGQGAKRQYFGLDLGSQIELGNRSWTVVGVFASGDAHDSELWTDGDTLASAYNRKTLQSVIVRVDGGGGFAKLKSALSNDPRLKLDIDTTRHYYAKQSQALTELLKILGLLIGAIMAIGAIFSALNTMYSSVASRLREIATMRAIGFPALPVVMGVMLETMMLALVGGLLGGGLAWLLFNGRGLSTLGSNFSQVMFQFRVTPGLIWSGMQWALGIGLVGGLSPALRAGRLPVTAALRAI